MKKVIIGAAIVMLSLTSGLVKADDYRWVKIPDPKGEQLIEVDPKICKLYEENLRYFAKQNIPLSCVRPIAPHLKDKIKEVEWEDLDPDRYPELFRAVVIQYGYLSKKSEDVIQKSLNYAREEIIKKIRIFRRAKLSLVGRIYTPAPTATPEPYWIVQYGFNTAPISPDEFYRCIPVRGGISNKLEYKLHLYIVSDTKQELTKSLSNARRPSSEGQNLWLIDGRLFVENINQGALIELNEVDTEIPMTDTVCIFQFKKSDNRGK